MAGQFVFGNFLETELLDDISNLADTIHIPVAMSRRLPYFDLDEMEARLVLWDGQNAPEILGAVINHQTGYLTVTRGQEDTTSRPWPAGTQVICSLTANIINSALLAYFDISAILNMNFLKLAGGTLTGPLILDADPTDDLGAVTKQYADNVIGNKLPLAGGTMLGSINMNTNRILNLPAPVASTEATRLADLTAVSDTLGKVDTDRSGVLVTAGTGSAYTVTNNSGQTSYSDGMTWSARMHTANLDAATMTLNSIGAKQIRVVPGQNIRAHVLQNGMPYDFMYDLAADVIYVKGALNSAIRNRAGDFKWSALETDHDDALLCDGRALSRTTYATLFSAIGTKFGAGDGSTTFNIPLGANKTLVGRDTNGTGYVSTTLTTTNTLTTATVASAAGLAIGMYINHPNVPLGTKINDISGLSITMSGAANNTGAAAGRFSVLSDPTLTGGSGGEITHTQQRKEVGQHQHANTATAAPHQHALHGDGAIVPSGSPVYAGIFNTNPAGPGKVSDLGVTDNATVSVTVNNVDSAAPLPTPALPPSLVANLFIYAY